MIWFISLTDVPCLFFKTELNSLLIWIKIPYLKAFLIIFLFMTDSCNFNSVFIYLDFNCLWSAFLIILARKVIFFLGLRNKVDSYNGLGFLLLFLFFFVYWFIVLFLALFIDYFIIFSIDSLFRKVSFGKLIENFVFSCRLSICWRGIIFWDLLNSCLFIFFVKFSDSVSNSFSIDTDFPKFIVWMVEINFLRQVEVVASNVLSLGFHLFKK